MNFKFPEGIQGTPTLLQNVPRKFLGTFGGIGAAYAQADQKTRRLYLVAGVAVVLLLAWLLFGHLFSRAPRGMPLPPVIVVEATSGNMNVMQKALGTVIANASVSITARVQGQLVSTGIVEGQTVKAGDLLFQIDPKPYQAALQQARAMLARDSAQAANARRDASRYQQLLKQQAISKQQHDNIRANAAALSASASANRAAMETAQLNLSYTQIRSPIDGKTGPILIQPGNLVRANDTQPLVVINQLQPVKVSFALPQTELPRLQKRMREKNLVAILYVHGTDTEIARAPVNFIGNAIEASTGTIELRATFPNKDESLIPGELVDVAVQLDQLKNVIVVPREAVNSSQDSRYVYVVNDKKIAEMREVEVLHDDGAIIALKGAVNKGEQVVIDGQLRVLPGKPVAITPKDGGAGTKPPAT